MPSDDDEAPEPSTSVEAPKPRSWLRIGLTRVLPALVILFLGAQLVPYRIHNPKTQDEPKWDSPQTRQLAVAACYDCHSNQTKSTWYSGVAPVSWWLTNHVDEGRQALNFSEWHTKAGRSEDLTEGIGHGMPPDYYTWLGLHSSAKLTPAQAQQLIDGIKATAAKDPPKGGRGGGEGGGEGGGGGDGG